ncbi:MAG: hypothetical protein K6E30_08795 [Lachnospiraceae bacterium]|nr:hypothetical protein [Lachnospiraceae bacterium]
MKRTKTIIYLLMGVGFGILAAVFLLRSSRIITYLEHQSLDSFSAAAVEREGKAAEALSLADGAGKSCYEITAAVIAEIRPGRALPAAAELCGKEGKSLCGLEPEVISDRSAFPDSGSDCSVLKIWIPFRMRPRAAEECSILFLDEEGAPWDLSAVVSLECFGGDRDPFWTGLGVFALVFALVFLAGGLAASCSKKRASGESWMTAMLVAALSFAVMSVLASEFNPLILDENDNILGGMLQSGSGYVMYRDFISQHTPFAYWLCALFARLGAKAFGQFRLLFALLFGITFGGLFFRFRKRRFAPAIALFAVFYGPLSFMLIPGNAGQVLSDNIQAAAMAVLLIELAAYYEDHGMDAARAFIISLSIFAAVGSAFMAVYAVFACMTAFFMEEFSFFRRKGKTFSFFLSRYLLLAGCVLAPWILAALYLGLNGALDDAFEMAFRFNMEVYAGYSLESSNPLKPLFGGCIRIGELLIHTWEEWRAGSVKQARLFESAMILMTAAVLAVSAFRRGLAQTFGLLFFIETQAVRAAVKFHSIMLWSVVFLFLLMELPDLSAELLFRRPKERKGSSGECGTSDPASAKMGKRNSGRLAMLFFYAGLILLFFGPAYCRLGKNVLDYRIEPVPEAEAELAALTEKGEKIFLDAGALKTEYIFYKGREPLGRLCWTLPWYYEWYEDETRELLLREKPRAAFYKPNLTVWGVSGFSKEIDEIIEREYVKQGQDALYVRKA